MIKVAKVAKDALMGIPGITTVKIGIEPNITPKDYPIIRIVPVDARPDNSIAGHERVSLDIYIGIADKFAKDGYEAIYEALQTFENDVKSRLNAASGAAFFWKLTKQDEDRLQNVKVIVARFEALG